MTQGTCAGAAASVQVIRHAAASLPLQPLPDRLAAAGNQMPIPQRRPLLLLCRRPTQYDRMLMNLQLRSIFLGAGVLVAVLGLSKWYKSTHAPASSENPHVRRTKVSEIEPGKYRFVPDIYTSAAEQGHAHTLLFLRKHDGSLTGLYLPRQNQVPALPAADGLTPESSCASFEISMEREQIECVAMDPVSNSKVIHHWSWDGQAVGPATPHLRQIAGSEKNGEFVFADAWKPGQKK